MSNQPVSARGGSKRRQIVTLTILLLLTGGLIGGAWYASRSQADNAKAGDCVAETGGDDIEIIECADPKAIVKVIGRIENKTRAEAGYGLSDVCDPFKGTEQMYWKGEQGKKGFVLCLAKNS